MIHIVTSKNKPNYEIELNEAWVLDKNAYGDTSDTKAGDVAKVDSVDRDGQGKVIASWSTIQVPDGRILLQGPEKFLYPDGKLMWAVEFKAGKKVGEERYLREDGTPVWLKTYAADGTWTWDSFDSARQTRRAIEVEGQDAAEQRCS